MAKNQNWQDDYWLLLMQIFLRKPVGVKPIFSRQMVELSIELHIPPQELHSRMEQIARLDTPRIERIWNEYSRNPKRLSRAVGLLRSMMGFNNGSDFYEGVAVEETFERDFRPLDEDERLTPVALIMMLNLYFQLTPATMVSETPEVQEMAKMIKVPVSLVIEILDIYQHCDPYLRRRGIIISPLLAPCQQIWQRYGNSDTLQLGKYVLQLQEFYR